MDKKINSILLPLFKNEPSCIKLDNTLSEILFSIDNCNYTILFLNTILSSSEAELWQKALAMQCLGCCHFYKGNYEKAKNYIIKSTELSNSKESLDRANYYKNVFGFDDYFNNFKIKETDNFIFHMDLNLEQTLGLYNIDFENYLKQREDAFLKINNFFNVKLLRKIDYFIWNSRDTAKGKLGRPLGFSHPEFYLIHTAFNQSIGHEMTHVISHYIDGFTEAVPLICEGVAVYFDLSGQDKLDQTKKAMEKYKIEKIDLRKLWVDWYAYPIAVTYPASAVLIKYLLNTYGEDKFKLLLKNQTYENAENIYGKELDKILNDVVELINK